MKLKASTVKEAKSIAGGLYSMNASSAVCYAFCVDMDNGSLSMGEFMYSSEVRNGDLCFDRFDGYVRDGVCHQLKENEVVEEW